MRVRFTTMTAHQRAGWYFASFVYGLCLVGIAVLDHSLDWLLDHEPWIVLVVFGTSWIVGVVGLRLYVQDKDPRDPLGWFKRKNK